MPSLRWLSEPLPYPMARGCADMNGSDDIFASQATALVNPVNCHGVMGRGLAAKFRKRYPGMYRYYQQACRTKTLRPGWPACVRERDGRVIVLFPTKDHWRHPSQLQWVEDGLVNLREMLREWGITSLAVPALGCGLGQLAWADVRTLIVQVLGGHVDIELYPPKEHLD